MTNTKDLILKLRAVYQEKKGTGETSYDKILEMMELEGFHSSKSTLSRLFGNNWDKYSFDYEYTLIPIANVLLDVGNYEEDDDTDTKAFKSLLRAKMTVIENNVKQIEELNERVEAVEEEAKRKYNEKFAKEMEKYKKSLDFAMEQIKLKDKRIDQLMDANDRLSVTNDRLINQLMDCPLRKGCQ